MHLRNDMRQKNTQKTLDFNSTPTGEARTAGGEATESFSARHTPENPASTNQLMEEVCERENLKQALQQVKANKGSPGIDGMTVEELPGYLEQHWPVIREQLLNGTYEPNPVRRAWFAPRLPVLTVNLSASDFKGRVAKNRIGRQVRIHEGIFGKTCAGMGSIRSAAPCIRHTAFL